MSEHLSIDVDVEGLDRTVDDPEVTADDIVEAYNEWAKANGVPPIKLRRAVWVVPPDAKR